MVRHWVPLKVFVARVSGKIILNEGFENDLLSRATVAEFLEPFLRVALTYMTEKNEGRFLGGAGAGYLPSGSNKVKAWGQCNGFLLVSCCGWAVILASACVEICWRWAVAVGCVAS